MSSFAFKTKKEADAFAELVRGRSEYHQKRYSGVATLSIQAPPGRVFTARVREAKCSVAEYEWAVDLDTTLMT